ncbi:DUF3078 domain-containing protein [uncultured Maribacter sp.]|uniref:DUF3078 domain-containing protein n=1 Tax=uncultured Maribacter sp. TaxID=431308 RepID=UPI00260CA286|nr:DUF3078 domain-containing protein [uncultured Maribacter sp.]
MKNNLFFSFLLLFMYHGISQDSLATTSEVDTTIINTIVIRKTQERIKHIPRSAKLTNPHISFKKTRPLSKKFKRFRVPSFWIKTNHFGVRINEAAFVNWNAGGNNSITALGDLKFERNYKFRYIQWDNYLELRYGLNAQEDRKLRKSGDAIRMSSTFGYRKDTITNWYYSVKANLRTQFSNGYKYPNRESPISRFMAPGYFFFGAGTSYITPDQKFNLYTSPVTLKATYVLDQRLADNGAFGVKKAVKDVNGEIITPGETVFVELGFLITNTWQTNIAKNVKMKHRLSLYTDYLSSFGNVDVDWELNFDLTVNKYIKANIGTHIIYDDDILFDEIKDSNGLVTDSGVPRIQFKQILGVGVSYDF